MFGLIKVLLDSTTYVISANYYCGIGGELIRYSCVPFMEQHYKRIEFCDDSVDISDKGLQRRRADGSLQLPEPSAGTIKLSYEGTGSLSQVPGGFYIERIVSLGMKACDSWTRELMIMRRLVSISAEVSGLGHLMRANTTSGSIYWGSGVGNGNIDDEMSSNRLGQADQHICSYLLLNIWVCLHRRGLLDDVYSGESLSDEILDHLNNRIMASFHQALVAATI